MNNPDSKYNIKPFIGLWRSFTNVRFFKPEATCTVSNKCTRDYTGIWRILMNAIAAFTVAKYDWRLSSYKLQKIK